MDYRQLNKHTVRDNNPLPNIQSALERLHGKLLFSKFDICWGYNNIHIAEEDQHKAAFKTPQGTYVPRVMYFGLTNAPPFFQRTMHRDFRPLLQKYPENLGNYMDDWWIATANDEEGKETPQTNRPRIPQQNGRMLLLPKAKEVSIREGRNGDPRLVSGRRTSMHRPCKGQRHIRMAPNPSISGRSQENTWGTRVPKTLHPRLCIHCTTPTRPHQKRTQFCWTQKCTDALDELIKRVTTEPVLWHPDPSKPYKLEVDASAFALGSILYQRDDNNKRRAVAYHSKALNQAKRNYSIGDREFLAIIEGLKRVQTPGHGITP